MSRFGRAMLISAAIAISIGVFVSAYIIWINSHQSYSALYLYPGYPNYVKPGSVVKFRYGVRSYESGNYTIKIIVGGKVVEVERLTLNPGESVARNVSVRIPKDAKFPLKVSVVMVGNGETYEVHFWLRRSE